MSILNLLSRFTKTKKYRLYRLACTLETSTQINIGFRKVSIKGKLSFMYIATMCLIILLLINIGKPYASRLSLKLFVHHY